MDQENLRAIFNLLDEDGKGYIDESDLFRSSAQGNFNLDQVFALLQMTPGEKLSFQQFCVRIGNVSSPEIASDEKEQVFEAFGEISLHEEQGAVALPSPKAKPVTPAKRRAFGATSLNYFADDILQRLDSLIEIRLEQSAQRRFNQDEDDHERNWRRKKKSEETAAAAFDWHQHIAVVEKEKANILARSELNMERIEELEKLLREKDDREQDKRNEIISFQRICKYLQNDLEKMKQENKELRLQLAKEKEKAVANGASLNRQSTMLHQDRLAFMLERIAFDNLREAIATGQEDLRKMTRQQSSNEGPSVQQDVEQGQEEAPAAIAGPTTAANGIDMSFEAFETNQDVLDKLERAIHENEVLSQALRHAQEENKALKELIKTFTKENTTKRQGG